jgi:hypothetical protein
MNRFLFHIKAQNSNINNNLEYNINAFSTLPGNQMHSGCQFKIEIHTFAALIKI